MTIMRKPGRYAALLALGMLAAAGSPAASAQAAALSAAGGPAQARTLSLPRLLHGAAPATIAASASFKVLEGVFCTSRTSCWAVGEQAGAGGMGLANQMLHGNGTTWRKVSVPNPGGTGATAESNLAAVRCVTVRDCWAVGAYRHGGAQLNQALHWNGRKWAKASTPNPGGSGAGEVSELADSTCITAANCWAVGDFGSGTAPNEKRLNQVLHWNGKKWSRLRVVNPGGTGMKDVNTLDSVRCLSATNCIATGEYGASVARNEVLHWNGKKWSQARTPNPGGAKLGDVSEDFALACSSADSCWGAGIYGSETAPVTLNEILHWNGKKWAKTTAPNPDGTGKGANNELGGATCESSADCWAVGNYGSTVIGTGIGLNDVLHWNGRKWAKVSTPNPGGTAAGDFNALLGVRCPSSASCWAVGVVASTAGGIQNEILHWNGKKWSAR